MGDTALDLDDILNSALDELDDEEEEKATGASAGGPLKGEAAAAVSGSSTSTTGSSTSTTGSSSSSSSSSSLGAAASSVSGAGAGPKSGSNSASGTPPASACASDEEEEERELQEAIAKTIGLLGKLDAPAGGEGAGAGGEGADSIFDDAFLNKLVEEFDKFGGGGGEGRGEGGGGGGGGDSMVDGMVKQLLAKDLMYPPLKEVTRQFPGWLEAHKGTTEAGAYKRYEEQHALFQQIVGVYEGEGEPDMGRLLDLMTTAQEYGQPPAEIVAALGVGSVGGGEGMALPPGLGGLPLGPDGAPDPEACAIM